MTIQIELSSGEVSTIKAGDFINLPAWRKGIWAQVDRVGRVQPGDPAFIDYWAHKNPDKLFLEKHPRRLLEFRHESGRPTIREVCSTLPDGDAIYYQHQVVWNGVVIDALPDNWNLALKNI